MDYSVQVAKAVVFFIINLTVYELGIFSIGAIIVAPLFCKKCKLSESEVYKITTCVMRIGIAIVAILMILWVFGIFRFIPIPD